MKTSPNLITHVAATHAAAHEVNCTAPIQGALAGPGRGWGRASTWSPPGS